VALKDRSLMPPASVTWQAVKAAAGASVAAAGASVAAAGGWVAAGVAPPPQAVRTIDAMTSIAIRENRNFLFIRIFSSRLSLSLQIALGYFARVEVLAD
jgi:hypothetical protein